MRGMMLVKPDKLTETAIKNLAGYLLISTGNCVFLSKAPYGSDSYGYSQGKLFTSAQVEEKKGKKYVKLVLIKVFYNESSVVYDLSKEDIVDIITELKLNLMPMENQVGWDHEKEMFIERHSF